MLLNYKEFQEKTKEEFLTYMSDEFKTGYTVHIEEKNLEKNVTEVLFLTKDDNAAIIFHDVALMPFYEKFYKEKRNGDFESSLKELASGYEIDCRKVLAEVKTVQTVEATNNVPEVPEETQSAIEIKDLIFSIEKMEDIHENSVYKELNGNLCMVLRSIVEKKEEQVTCHELELSDLPGLKMKKEELFSVAKDNMKKIFPPHLEEILNGQYYLSTDYGIYGASTLYYDHSEIKKLSDKTGKDILILPVSTHGVILEPVESLSHKDMDEYSKALNEYAKGENVLGKNLMVYSKEKKTIIFDTASLNLETKKRGGIFGAR